MIQNLRIRLANWKDREAIQPLRALLGRPVDGGLYELLNWSVYHAHIALVEGRPVGFTSVALLPQGVADDMGTVVIPEFRLHRVASELRATQLRDLSRMGYARLYCAAPETDEAISMGLAHFGEPLGRVVAPEIQPHAYFGATLPQIGERLQARGVRAPYPLSDENHRRLLMKAERALHDLTALNALMDFNMRKAELRG